MNNNVSCNNYTSVIKVTLGCPGMCKSCTNRRSLFSKKKNDNGTMDLNLFSRICNELKTLGGKYVSLSGGEPTILPNLDQYIEIAKNNNLAVRINTNGWGFTEKNLSKWLDKGLDQIVLSLYGLTPEQVTETRGRKEIYERSMNALNIISKVRNSRTFLFIIQTIIMKNSYLIIPDLLEKAIEYKCDFFWPSYLEDAYNLSDLKLSNYDIDNFKKVILPKLKKLIDDNFFNEQHQTNLNEQIEKYFIDESYVNGFYHTESTKRCTLPERFLLFYPNGLVAPCPGHEYFSSNKEESIYEKSLEEIILSDNFKCFRNNRDPYCLYCPQELHVGFKLNPNDIHEHISAKELELHNSNNL